MTTDADGCPRGRRIVRVIKGPFPLALKALQERGRAGGRGWRAPSVTHSVHSLASPLIEVIQCALQEHAQAARAEC